MAKSTINIPELETLSYKPKVPTLSDMAKVRIEADKAVHAILPIRQSEQPKDNPGPLENLIMDRIEHDLENIAANLEMLNPETKEQKRAKCILTLEIARITGEGGIFDDLKEAFE